MKLVAWSAVLLVLAVAGCADEAPKEEIDAAGLFVSRTTLDVTPEQNEKLQGLWSVYGQDNVHVVRALPGFQERFTETKLAGEILINDAAGFFDNSATDPLMSWKGLDVEGPDLGLLESGTYSSTSIETDIGVIGTITTTNGQFLVRPIGGGLHAIIESNNDERPPEHPEPRQERKDRLDTPPMRSPTPGIPAGNREIRVLTLYSNSAREEILKRGFPTLDSFDQLMFQELRDSFASSSIDAKVMRAGLKETEFASTDFSGSLDSLVAIDDGVLDEVHSWRKENAADIVVLVFNNNEACGEAADIDASPMYAFAVVHYNCATGYYSFAHEIGHLIGARHNVEADPTPGSAHGHYVQSRKWRSIMSYDCPGGCTRFLYWSSPDRALATGEPMGVKSVSDNTGQWQQRISTAANLFETLDASEPGARDRTPMSDEIK